MPTITPLESGKFYHIYNRGNNGENLFITERNYSYFLNLYAAHIQPVAETFAYCLLHNHFHLCVRIQEIRPGRFSYDDQATITVNKSGQTTRIDRPGKTCQVSSASQAFSNLFNAYTKSINKAYGRTGSLFEKPFQRIEVTSQRYLMQLIHSIHWNPQKHGFVKDFRDWPFSSYQVLLSDKPTLIQRQQVLDWFNGRQEFDAVHRVLTDEKEIRNLIIEDES